MFSKIQICPLAACFVLLAGMTQAAEPQASVKLTIPDYVVSKVENVDEVSIPDGELLSLEGRPQVPYCVKAVKYPPDFRIQEVVLRERTGMKADSGLALPVAQPDTGQVEVETGVYPLKDFEWKVLYNQGDSATLFIYVYPFYYDPKTTKVTFYRNYQFDIRSVMTTVAIGGISVDKPVYDPDEKVKIGLRLENSGPVQEVVVAASIFKAFRNEKVADVPSKSLKRLGKADSVSLEWPTGGFSTGMYQVEATVKDPAGNELARERTLFRLGNPQGEITNFKVTPEQFKIGEPIEMSTDFKNTGTCDLSGEAVFRIMTETTLVDELRMPMATLRPGGSTTFRKSWDTDKAEKGAIYHAVGFVDYEGGSSGAKSALISTNRMPVASFSTVPEKPSVGQTITFDGSASTDPDGTITAYHWAFDDGAQAADSVVTHSYHQTGDYSVTLTVTDNEGGTATAKKIISIKE